MEIFIQKEIECFGSVIEDSHKFQTPAICKTYEKFVNFSSSHGLNVRYLRVMTNAKLKNLLRPVPDHGREDVENVEEQCVAPAVANFGVWFPYHFHARIHANFFVQNFGEAFQ